MRCNRLVDAGQLAVAQERPPNIFALQARIPAHAGKQRVVGILASCKIPLDPLQRPHREKHRALLVALSYDSRFPYGEIDLVQIEREYFTDAHGRSKQDFNQSAESKSG